MRVQIARAGADLSVTFSDSGPGVDPGLRERIFEHGFSTKPAGADGPRASGWRSCGTSSPRPGAPSASLPAPPTAFSVVLLPAEPWARDRHRGAS